MDGESGETRDPLHQALTPSVGCFGETRPVFPGTGAGDQCSIHLTR